jgi:NitT/TauT family transport system ATP-binding protein
VPPTIELDRVERRFPNGTLALDACSLAVAPGEFVTLLGPSGCGKSTVLRLVAGLDRPSAGTIRVTAGASDAASDGTLGGASGALTGASSAISFVFQEPTLMPWATVFDNVWLPRRLAGESRAAARADIESVLARVGLEAFANAWPRELSGGMKMRVSIARALVSRPRVLLMDEPFAALDEITRERLNDDLLDWCRALGLTVVFVTHSVFEAVYLSQRVLVMRPRPGRVVDEIAIDAPFPRGDEFRTSERYARWCAQASRALRGSDPSSASAGPEAAGRATSPDVGPTRPDASGAPDRGPR